MAAVVRASTQRLPNSTARAVHICEMASDKPRTRVRMQCLQQLRSVVRKEGLRDLRNGTPSRPSVGSTLRIIYTAWGQLMAGRAELTTTATIDVCGKIFLSSVGVFQCDIPLFGLYPNFWRISEFRITHAMHDRSKEFLCQLTYLWFSC